MVSSPKRDRADLPPRPQVGPFAQHKMSNAFSPSAVAGASKPSQQLPYAAFVRSGEPYRSLMRRGFHDGASGGLGVWSSDARRLDATGGLDFNDRRLFYNTQTPEKAAYWADKALPRPTTDLFGTLNVGKVLS